MYVIPAGILTNATWIEYVMGISTLFVIAMAGFFIFGKRK